jgi:hypothetical protein
MTKLAVVVSKSPTGDVYIIGEEDVKAFTSHGYTLGGYADTEEEAEKLAESFC